MAMPTNDALEDVANSLDIAPLKMRCGICDKLAFNAFRTPCCDQTICAKCQASLPTECPICSHSPLSRDTAKPNRSMRLTINAHLKGVKKKLEKAADTVEASGSAGASAVTPAGPTPSTDPLPAPTGATSLEPSEAQHDNEEAIGEAVAPAQDEPLDTVQSAEVSEQRVADETAEVQQLEATGGIAQSVEEPSIDDSNTTNDDGDSDTESDVVIITGDEHAKAYEDFDAVEDEYQQEQWQDQQQGGMNQINGGGFGSFNGQNDFSNMMNPDMMNMMMQQMQQMTGMQNGNWNNMMGKHGRHQYQQPRGAKAYHYNKGMPGMGMNPMDMSSMFGGFGMQGMGNMNSNMMNMNAMNGMMGMDFSGNFGNGGGWNGQQMGGDYGASNGYYPDGGYNQSHQGNYPHMSRHQQQFSKNAPYNQNSFSRGSNRGFGRGYHNQGNHGRQQSQNFPGPDQAPLNAPKGPRGQRQQDDGPFNQQVPSGPHSRVPSKGSEQQRDTTNAENPSNGPPAENTNLDQTQVSTAARDLGAGESNERELNVENETSTNAGDITTQEDGKVHNDYYDQANNDYGHQSTRGGHRGRGGFEGRGGWRGRGGSDWRNQNMRGSEQVATPPTEPTGAGVQGAPSGPKAMREGNTWANRGRGAFGGAPRGHSQSISSRADDQSFANGNLGSDTASHHDHRAPRMPARSTSRDRSRSPGARHRSRRQKSPTPTYESEYERNRRERKRQKADRKYEDEHSDNERDRRRHDDSLRSRDQSPDDKYRSSKRDKDRHRSSKSHRDSSRERRRHRHRSRSRDRNEYYEDELSVNGDAERKDRDRRREKDKYRDRSQDRDRRDRDKDREREKKRSSRRDRSESRDAEERRSSHRSKHDDKKKDKDYGREKERDSRRESNATSKTSRPETPSVQKQLEQGFRIHGRAREKPKSEAVTPTVSTPIADTNGSVGKMQPPSGPRADRASSSSKIKLDLGLNTKVTPAGTRGSAASSRRPSQPPTPTSAATPSTPVDPYEEERRKAQQARIAKEMSRRQGSDTGDLSRKRSWVDDGDDAGRDGGSSGKKIKKATGASGRRISYKYEGDDDLARGEGERESARWSFGGSMFEMPDLSSRIHEMFPARPSNPSQRAELFPNGSRVVPRLVASAEQQQSSRPFQDVQRSLSGDVRNRDQRQTTRSGPSTGDNAARSGPRARRSSMYEEQKRNYRQSRNA